MSSRSPLYRSHQPPILQQEIDRLYRLLGDTQAALETIVETGDCGCQMAVPAGGMVTQTDFVGYHWQFIEFNCEQLDEGDHYWEWPLAVMPHFSGYMMLECQCQYLPDLLGIGGDTPSSCEWQIGASVPSIPGAYWPSVPDQITPVYYRWGYGEQPAYTPGDDDDPDADHPYKYIPVVAMDGTTPLDDTIMLRLSLTAPVGGMHWYERALVWGQYMCRLGSGADPAYEWSGKCPGG